MCKSQIKDVQEEVIPIYSGGRSSKKEIDPRTRPRPKPKVVPAPTSQTSAAGSRGLFGVGGGFQGISPFWDVGGGPGGSGWTVQAGVFPFPGLSFGWSSANGGAGAPLRQPGPAIYARTLNPPLNPQEAQEQARIQQRNALILFGIMILLFTLRESALQQTRGSDGIELTYLLPFIVGSGNDQRDGLTSRVRGVHAPMNGLWTRRAKLLLVDLVSGQCPVHAANPG